MNQVANAQFSRLNGAYEVLRRVPLGLQILPHATATRPSFPVLPPTATRHALSRTPRLQSHPRSVPAETSSPNQRAIYDVYGSDGLRAGLDLGPALRTPEDLRAELQARAAAAKARDAEARVNYKATYVFGACSRGTLFLVWRSKQQQEAITYVHVCGLTPHASLVRHPQACLQRRRYHRGHGTSLL